MNRIILIGNGFDLANGLKMQQMTTMKHEGLLCNLP